MSFKTQMSYKFRETGFTLMELLTVIIIIGILAAIAIPVFSSQRGRAADAQTVSDVRNAATFAETYLSDSKANLARLSKSSSEYTAGPNIMWGIKPNLTTGGFCIAAYNLNGKKYVSEATALTYDSTAGGLGKSSGSCLNNIPTPTNSDTSQVAPEALVASSQASTWALNSEDYLWQSYADAANGSLYVADYSGTNAGLWKVSLSDGSKTLLNSERGYFGVTKVGNRLYVSDSVNYANIYEIDPATGVAVKRFTNGTNSQIHNLATDGVSIYASRKQSGQVIKLNVAADGSLSFPGWGVTNLPSPSALAIDSTGTMMYIGADDSYGSIIEVNLKAGTSRVLGYGGAGYIYSLLPSANNKVLIGSEEDNVIRSIDTKTGVTSSNFAAQLTSNGFNNAITGLSSDGTYLYASSINSGGPVKMGVYRF